MAENKVVALNLGPVTSYGLAKSKGFPGTEEAWVEKMMATATDDDVDALDEKIDDLDTKVDTQVETINATIEQEVGAVDTKADGIAANLTTLSGVVAQKMDTTVAQASFVPVPSASGAQGDALRNNGDGTTAWAPIGLPTDEQTGTAINAWLTAHPEATTTVQDGAITRAKLITDLQEKTDLAQNATAPAFDATVAYAPGAHVTYGGKLYVLPSGHEANATWADTTKTEVNLGGEVSDLKSAFVDNDVAGAVTYSLGYINGSGNIASSATHYISAMIPVEAGESYNYYGYEAGNIFVIGFYETSESTTALTAISIGAPQTTKSIDFEIPSGVKFMRVSYHKDYGKPTIYKRTTQTMLWASLEQNLSYPNVGFIFYNDGSVVNDNTFHCTDYIEIHGNRLKMQMPFYSQASIAFYDSTKTYIANSSVRNTSSTAQSGDIKIYDVEIPATAKYFRTTKADALSNTYFSGAIPVYDTGTIHDINNEIGVFWASLEQNLSYSIPGFIFYNDGSVAQSNVFHCTDFYEINGDMLKMQMPFYSQASIAFYDSTKTYIVNSSVKNTSSSAQTGDNTIYTVIIPANAKYFRTSKADALSNTYFSGAIAEDDSEAIREIKNETGLSNEILCPSKLYVAQDMPVYYYPLQMALNSKKFEMPTVLYQESFTSANKWNRQNQKDFAYMTYNSSGDMALAMRIDHVKNDNTVEEIANKNVSIISYAKPTSKTAKVLVIGDSYFNYPWITDTTQGSIGEGVMSQIDALATADGNTVQFIGTKLEYTTQGGTAYYGEAYGGWTENSFLSSDSPFYINGQIDFGAYFEANGTPDIILFFLGMNYGMGSGIDTMITAIKTASANTKIIVCTVPPWPKYWVAVPDDLYAKELRRQNQNKNYLTLFDDRINDGIIVCPIHMTFERTFHYIHSNTKAATYPDEYAPYFTQCYNNHPSSNGAKTIAYVVYDYLLYFMKDM